MSSNISVSNDIMSHVLGIPCLWDSSVSNLEKSGTNIMNSRNYHLPVRFQLQILYLLEKCFSRRPNYHFNLNLTKLIPAEHNMYYALSFGSILTGSDHHYFRGTDCLYLMKMNRKPQLRNNSSYKLECT